MKSGARESLLEMKTEKYLEHDLKKILLEGKNLGISLNKVKEIINEIYKGGVE